MPKVHVWYPIGVQGKLWVKGKFHVRLLQIRPDGVHFFEERCAPNLHIKEKQHMILGCQVQVMLDQLRTAEDAVISLRARRADDDRRGNIQAGDNRMRWVKL